MNCWIEAMRLRTLPVSIAGVIAATGFAAADNRLRLLPATLCLIFAILAQIASNFANEYYDFRKGLDRVGRDGPQRSVTEGLITPNAMRNATFLTLAVACMVGCSLIYWGGWWLLPAGILIALGVLAYSSGPYPLSHHGLGEVAVVFFFGIIPVNLTYYVVADSFSIYVLLTSVGMGLMGANVLIVNNYRDHDDDYAVGKHTLAVILGRKAVSTLYLFNGFIGMTLIAIYGIERHMLSFYILTAIYLCLHTTLWWRLTSLKGRALNPLLGMTAILMLALAIALSIILILLRN